MINALAGDAELGERDFRILAGILRDEARIALSPVKRTLVQSRLGRRLRQHGLGDFGAYVRLVQEDADERRAMVTALTTNHTHFFRERHHFDHFTADVRPMLQQAAGRRSVRLWSAGSSSGEEVYSLAMCLAGSSRPAGEWLANRDVRLLASDVSAPMVTATAAARYSRETVAAVPADYASAWLKRDEGGATISPFLVERVHARMLNLFDAWPMTRKFDVIFCRNVMIYFDDPAKRELELRLVQQLQPGGFLYIGHSERLGGEAEAQMESMGHTIYRKPGTLP
ncbi:protein-glutamate O-methyltransferase CheR [Sphingomonas sp. KRR8]|uniref:CheR family methyltransferase n=1 Tax=Sphingomonas sp. KRR8 TaxID=2942996 RepID=UPI0020206E25|nr:protein-glutamate O-methyltransferase CheR [Sphingomonas sp. KRR8]URD61922.1 protein-glutamate O-methyltransferase CheR [Sphingomonas sp. KRR8]